ncbi:MAG: hypothetical protein JWR54_3064 [Mucilaginibacter sp.]|nr:hypothetical protein [Mucilaginibacter sp.]
MFWRDIAFYITPKLYKKSEFWRDIAFYITSKRGETANEPFFGSGLSETGSLLCLNNLLNNRLSSQGKLDSCKFKI